MTKKRLVLIGMVLLVMLSFGAPAAAQRSDTDGDGVLNASDKCPTVPGPASNGGCPIEKPPQDTPDQDGDGVPDYVDACPTEVGTGYTNGCPAEAPADNAPAATVASPQILMFWENTTECMVGVALTPGINVNVREQPTTSSAVIGQLAPGQQFAPFFRDYDENNAIWFGGAPAGDTWGWVAGSVVITNGQCVNLPMIIHIDAPDNSLLMTGTLGDFELLEPTPEPTPDAEDGLFSLPDLLTWDGAHGIVLDSGQPSAEKAGGDRNNYMIFTLKEVFVTGFGNPSPPGDDPPASPPPPPPSPAPPPAKTVSVVIQIIGVLVGTEPEPLPVPTAKPSPPPTRTLPVLLVIADMSDADCAPVSPDSCLQMLLQLPDFGDQPGQCPPDSDSARRLPKLLEAAIKGKVFKKVEIHGTARSSDPSQPEVTLSVDADGSVVPQGLKTDTTWDYGCSIVGFVPTGESEMAGDGSVSVGVQSFVILLPAV